MIPVGIVLLLLEVIIEFLDRLEIPLADDRQVFLVTKLLFFIFGVIGTLDAARAEVLPGQGG